MNAHALNRSSKFTLPVLLLATLAACNQEQAQTSEPEVVDRSTVEGLRLVAVFGPDRIDVSEDIDWFGTEIGIVESENITDNGLVFSYEWAEEFRSDGVDGVYPVAEGEVGVELDLFRGLKQNGRYQLPPVENGFQVLEVPLTNVGRLVLNAPALTDDTLTELAITGSGGSVSTQGWRFLKGSHYLEPIDWDYELTLTNMDTGESHSRTFRIAEGETVELNFEFVEQAGSE